MDSPVVALDLIKARTERSRSRAELSIKMWHPICLHSDRHSCLAAGHMVVQRVEARSTRTAVSSHGLQETRRGRRALAINHTTSSTPFV